MDNDLLYASICAGAASNALSQKRNMPKGSGFACIIDGRLLAGINSVVWLENHTVYHIFKESETYQGCLEIDYTNSDGDGDTDYYKYPDKNRAELHIRELLETGKTDFDK